MQFDDKKIKEVLLGGNYVTPERIEEAEKFLKTHRESNLADYLLSSGLVTREVLGQVISGSFGLPYVDLSSVRPPREQVLKIPETTAKKHRVVLFSEDEKGFVVATDSPDQPDLVLKLKQILPLGMGKSKREIILAYAFPDDINQTLVHYKQPLKTLFTKIIETHERVAPEIIEEILEDAIVHRASDVHFEPQEKEVVVRFRVDGVLQEAGRIPKEYYENILNKIKVQSHLRIDEHFSAQDGAMRYNRKSGDRKPIDIRVSIVPTLDGEKIAIRLLSQYVRSFTLDDLGLSIEDQKLVTDSSKKPFGMILVTGPTGSGKTTTLYALLKILNRPDVNITTIEDPVEYKILGVNQIQVNPQTNLTFAKGLRSIVRQDPDVVLVGEIRDSETAEIAVNAALTGHLLLSTFHANDSATAIPRLIDMGVEPFLLASTLELIAAQRLVRKICESCRQSKEMKIRDVEKILPNATQYFPNKRDVTFYEGKGCNVCGNTGYRDRMAIFEFINVTREIQELILTNPSTEQVWKLARSQGAHSLFEDGLRKVKSGMTTLEELLRVAAPDG